MIRSDKKRKDKIVEIDKMRENGRCKIVETEEQKKGEKGIRWTLKGGRLRK